MFDEIFKRWINTGQLSENDIVPLFLEWNQTFGDGKGTPQEVISLLHVIQTDYYRIMCKILKYVGIIKGYNWAEIYDKNGTFVARYWNKPLKK